MQTVNLLTFELKEKGSNIYHYLKKPLNNLIFSLNILARFVGADLPPFQNNVVVVPGVILHEGRGR